MKIKLITNKSSLTDYLFEQNILKKKFTTRFVYFIQEM